MKRIFLILFLLESICFSGVRSEKYTGFDIGFGQPLPSFVGAMVGLNASDLVRFSLGLGTLVNWVTYQADIKVFLFTTSFTPYMGGGFNMIRGRPGDYLGRDLEISSTNAAFLEGGLDYTADSGFHTSANIGFCYADGTSFVLPGLAFGWYF
ncbi:MAG: hypothetical protein AB7F43_00610 [Bacteriovoracia bacterium]